jgi:hypothetical protein
MIRSIFLALMVSASALSTFCQNGANASQEDLQQGAQNLMKLHQVWGSRASTPNMSVAIKEASRSGDVLSLRLYADGLPKDKTYTIVQWPVTQARPSDLMSGVTFDSAGLAVCAGTPGTCVGNGPNDPIDLLSRPVPGEPVRFAAISDDHKIKAFAKIVPVPIKGEDRGCTIEAVLLTPDASLLWIEATGFTPNGTLKINGNSEGEHHDGTVKADANGGYIFSVEPFKKGLNQGTIQLTLQESKCSPSIKVPWGHRGANS